MFYQKTFFISLLTALSMTHMQAETKPIELSQLDGNWHLRIMDGMEVRKARAILDFDSKQMKISGFDACNQISGTLIKNSDLSMSSQLISTRMACRQPIHTYVSQRLHETMKEGFNITEVSRNGVDGITLKSAKHELFFGRMGESSILDKLVK